MRYVIKYQVMIIPGKLKVEVKLNIDDRSMFESTYNDIMSTSLTLYPVIGVSIIRPPVVNDDGTRSRAVWVANDNLGMTKYSMVKFINELSEMRKDMNTPELYTYQGKRLELNETIAASKRRPFMIGNTAVEFSPQVIVQEDESRIEGIKMKFNNESSAVMLTLNDMDALEHNLRNTNVDILSLMMYKGFMKSDKQKTSFDPTSFQTKVDIKPKESEFT